MKLGKLPLEAGGAFWADDGCRVSVKTVAKAGLLFEMLREISNEQTATLAAGKPLAGPVDVRGLCALNETSVSYVTTAVALGVIERIGFRFIFPTGELSTGVVAGVVMETNRLQKSKAEIKKHAIATAAAMPVAYIKAEAPKEPKVLTVRSLERIKAVNDAVALAVYSHTGATVTDTAALVKKLRAIFVNNEKAAAI